MGLLRKKQAEKETAAAKIMEETAEIPGQDGRPANACYERLERLFTGNREGVVLKLYIENFKRLNELFGYSYCEELLGEILDYLEQETNFPVYRYVGVEFLVILRNYSQGQAIRLAEKLIERFERGWTVGNTDCLCAVEIGMCAYPGYASNADELLKCLDMASSKVAEMGSNQYVMYDSALHNQFLRRQAIARYLQTALEKDEIEVRYRPTYDVEKQKFTRAEFYMRIFIQNIGMVGAAEFLPIAEDSGQIRAIEYYALDKVAALIAGLVEAGREFESIALPISPVLLLQGDFLDAVEKVIGHYQIPAGKLAIEIDEYTMSMAYVTVTELMNRLKELGVELIISNFGAGYSGITQIFELPVDTVKFSRLFAWQLDATPQVRPVVEGLSRIARNMGVNLIAEGVETDSQLACFQTYGCTLQQGFYYSPTLPADVLGQVLNTSKEASQLVLIQEKDKMRQ